MQRHRILQRDVDAPIHSMRRSMARPAWLRNDRGLDGVRDWLDATSPASRTTSPFANAESEY